MEELETKTKKFDKKSGKEFDKIANAIFAPVYPVIAKQIIDNCKINDGVCIDLGSGPGHLAIAVAKLSNLIVYGIDFSEDILAIAEDNINAHNLSGRVKPVYGDVNALPFENNFADLIISRGSLFFWQNIEKAFKEIYRILKPGGKTYIGGGFGSEALRLKVDEEMKKIDENWKCAAKKKLGRLNTEKVPLVLDSMGIQNYKIINDESGMWVNIAKY